MESQKQNFQEKIKEIYSKFNHNPYYLHSVLIHEGSDNSGHYYVYIRNHKKGTYFKFNDT